MALLDFEGVGRLWAEAVDPTQREAIATAIEV
jgi:hypothetical protein